MANRRPKRLSMSCTVGGVYDPAAVCLRERGGLTAGGHPCGLTSLLPLGIMAGLFIGKPLGISLFCWLA
ncbi:Na+/H+ antiporter NhaA type [Klebsiella pneumoniae]|uniref:Na+/H+ antiporter NhaA type n=1 Tax=Klebsiella pneumoniae TaxID=573 RepID=A0A378FXD1_KLEPN|nr:Na+/H+ antiporter NhaA type [Klebsiella pneumoniae]